MDKVREASEDVFNYGFNVWDLQVMEETGNETYVSSSKRTFEQKLKKAEGQGGDDKEILEVLVTNRADVMSVITVPP